MWTLTSFFFAENRNTLYYLGVAKDNFNFTETVESLEGRSRRLSESHEARMLGNDEVVGAAAKVVKSVHSLNNTIRLFTISVGLFSAVLAFIVISALYLGWPKEVRCEELEDGNLDCQTILSGFK